MPINMEEITAATLDALPQAVIVASSDGEIVMRNAAARTMLPGGGALAVAVRTPEAAGFDWPGLLGQLTRAPGALSLRNVSLTARLGRRLAADVYMRPLGGGMAVVVVEEMSDRLCLEQKHSADERMAAVSKLTAQIAHELNNPLDGVMRFISLAQRTAGPGAAKYLDGAKTGLVRMGEIIRGLLAKGGGGNGRGPSESLLRLLEEAVNVMSPRAGALGVMVVVDASQEASIPVSRSFFQVLCNVIKNALDAMPSGGTLRVALARRQGQCVLEFADTGCGLSSEEAQKIFEPFYTTKPPGEGLGLGLALCREIVTAAGGRISAAPGPSGGAVITIALPVR